MFQLLALIQSNWVCTITGNILLQFLKTSLSFILTETKVHPYLKKTKTEFPRTAQSSLGRCENLRSKY